MKGRTLVIGLILFTLLAVTAIFFVMKKTISDMEESSAITEYVEMNESDLVFTEFIK